MQQCNNNGVPSMQKTARSGFDHPSNKNERIATRHSHFAFPCNDCVNFEKRGAKKKYTEEKRKRTKRNEKKREEKNKTRRKKKRNNCTELLLVSPSLSLFPSPCICAHPALSWGGVREKNIASVHRIRAESEWSSRDRYNIF